MSASLSKYLNKKEGWGDASGNLELGAANFAGSCDAFELTDREVSLLS